MAKQSTFTDLLKKATLSALGGIPFGIGGLTRILQTPGVAERVVRKLPERPIKAPEIRSTPIKVGGYDVGKFGYDLGSTAVTELLNLPTRVPYNISRIKTAQTPQDYMRGVFGLGEAALDIPIAGTAVSLGKSGARSLANRSFSDLLRTARRGGVQGFKLGSLTGGLIGGQQAVDEYGSNVPYSQMLQNIGTGTAIGAGLGTTLGAGLPFVGAGTDLTRRMMKDTTESLLSPSLRTQAGSIDVKSILKGNTFKSVDDWVKRMRNVEVKQPKTKKLIDYGLGDTGNKVVNSFRLQGDKSFVQDKAVPYVKYVTQKLGNETIEKLYREDLKFPKKGSIASFHNKVKTLLPETDWRVIEKMADDSLYKQTVKAESIKNIIKEPQKGYNKVDQIIAKLPTKDSITSDTVVPIMRQGIAEFKQLFKDIEREAIQKVSKADFVDMIEGKKTIDPAVRELVDLHRRATGVMHELTENPDIGKLVNYFPHATNTVNQVMDELLPDLWIDRTNLLGGHFMTRSGTLTDYNKDYAKVMGDYTEQVLYEKYRNVISPMKSKAAEEVVGHVKKLGDKSMDYVDTLGADIKDRKTIKFKTRSGLPGGPARTYDDIFSKIGKEAPAIRDVYRRVRDFNFQKHEYANNAAKLVEKNDDNSLIKYFADKLGLKGEEAFAFIDKSKYMMNKYMDSEEYASTMIKTIKKYRTQDLVETLSQYKFENGGTKQYVNDFIDSLLKMQSLEPALLDGVVNKMMRVLYAAHLGLNVKTALLQGLEITRLPARYDPDEFVSGFVRSFTDNKRLQKDYGFANVKPHYLIENWQTKVKKSLPKTLAEKAEKVLFGPLQAMENWKNRVYTAAAESKGKKMNLKGKELTNFVRDEVYRHAHIADWFNTPAFLMSKEKLMRGATGGKGALSLSTFNRALAQYSQFAIKNAFGVLDAIQEKNLRKTFLLSTANMFNMWVTMSVFGLGMRNLKNVVGGFIPTGPGPLMSLPFDLWDAASDYRDKAEAGKEGAWEKIRMARILIGSVLPAGTQYLKTSNVVDMLQKGYSGTATDLVRFPKPNDKTEILMGLLFGQGAMKSYKEYKDKQRQTLGETDSETYRKLYSQSPAKAVEFYEREMEERENKDIKNLLKNKKTKTNMTFDGTDITLVTPKGSTYSISELIAQDQKKKDNISTVKSILKRTGDYKNVPEDESVTQMLLEEEGLTQKDVIDAQMSMIVDTDKPTQAKIAYKLLSEGTPMATLVEHGVLTDEIANEMERQGLISNADDMKDNMKKLDPYYVRKEMRKLKQDTVEKMLKIDLRTKKKMIDLQYDRMADYDRAAFQAQKGQRQNMIDVLKRSTRARKIPKAPSFRLPTRSIRGVGRQPSISSLIAKPATVDEDQLLRAIGL